jgi:hypothetical protein
MTHTFANSAAVPVPLRFSKQQLFEELAWFMPAFVRSFVRMVGPHYSTESAAVAEPSLQVLQASPMWRSLSELYEYGVHGVLPTISELGDGSLFDVELFLDGIDGLRCYLREDDCEVPKLSKATMALARARQDLDESALDQQVAIEKVALLARLPEEAVCSRLGVPIGTSTSICRARGALVQMFGFPPTGSSYAPHFDFVQSLPTELPIDVVRAINERAGLTGITPFEILRLAFGDEISRDRYQPALTALQSIRQVNGQ